MKVAHLIALSLQITLMVLPMNAMAENTPPLAGDKFKLGDDSIYCNVRHYSEIGLMCESKSALTPTPEKDHWFGCNEVYLPNSKPAEADCLSETLVGDLSPVLKTGKTWQQENITCTAAVDSVSCSNTNGHHLFLDTTGHWKVD